MNMNDKTRIFPRLAGLVVVMAGVLAGCGGGQSVPLSAVITAPDATTVLQVGQPTQIVAKAAGSGLKSVDLYVDGQKFAGVGQPGADGAFALNAPWTPGTPNIHVLQIKGSNDKGEEILKSEPLFVTVKPLPATATPAATATPVVVATNTPAPTATPAGPSVKNVDNEFVNVRSGPGTTYDILGQIKQNESAPVTGKNGDGQWWQISFAGKSGWVFGQLVTFTGDANAVKVASAPAAPAAPVVKIVPTAGPAPIVPTATPNMPPSAFLPYSQNMRFEPRDDLGDVPLGMNPNTKSSTLAWTINGAKSAYVQIAIPGGVPDIYDCPLGDAGTVSPGSLNSPTNLTMPSGRIDFSINGKGVYLMTIFVTKADGSQTTIPRYVIVDCYKKPGR